MEATPFIAQLGAARAGNRAACEALLGAFREELVGLARPALRSRVRSKLDAEDVVQDTLLLAYQRLGQFRGSTPAELAGWLRRILASQLARVIRRYYETRSRDLKL